MVILMGLDLGQAADFTAFSIIEYSRDPRRFLIRHLQRYPLGTPYPEIVDKSVAVRSKLRGGTFCIDATGVGAPILDLFYGRGLTPVAITITGGDLAKSKAEIEAEAKKRQGLFYIPPLRDRMSWHVPKRDLVGALMVAFQNHELKISSQLPDAKTLIDELLNFRMKINLKTGHDSYEAWREGAHDDLVLAVALPVWYATKILGKGTGKVSESSMTGQHLPPVPEVMEQQKDIWGRSQGFSISDIPGLDG